MTDESPIPAEALEVARVLNAAADLIEPEGAWTQGVYEVGNCWCMLGAIKRAGGYAHDQNPAAKAMRKVLDLRADQYPHEWNDAPERTQAEVVAKLREAAGRLLSTKESGNG